MSGTVKERTRKEMSNTIEQVRLVNTGYYIDNNIIWGPEDSGEYWINGKRIWGPKNSGKYQIDEESGRIFGPDGEEEFYVDEMNRIIGPNTTPPWMR